MNKIIAPLVKFLESLECHYEIDRAKGVLHSGLENKNAMWRWMAQQDDEGRYVMVSLLPIKASEPRRNACAELLVRINNKVGLGHFDLDFSDGQIAFRTAIPVGEGSRLRMSVIEHVIRGHQTLVNQFFPSISAVLFAGQTPEEALAAAKEREKEAFLKLRFSLN